MKHLTSKYMVLATLALMLTIRAIDPWPVESLRLRSFDAIMETTGIVDASDVVAVDIGEPSIARNGQWPWPRDVVAQLVTKIAARNPAHSVLFLISILKWKNNKRRKRMFRWLRKLIDRVSLEIRYRKKLKELRKRDPFIYK